MTALDRLRTIGLQELVEQAAMQTRVDRKYVLPRDDLGEVLQALDPATRVLDEGGRRGFAYESVYFDTPDLASYLSAARKRRRRFKIRTRAYLDSAEAYLEVKTRGGRSLTVKDRIAYGIDDRAVLTAEGREHVDLVLADAGIGSVGPGDLRPTLVTRYARTTLLLPDAVGRATVDEDLEWASPDGRRVRLPELAIVETKSGSSPSTVDRLFWSRGHRPCGISKYGVGMAALDPGLPANKWSRILRRHFAGPALLGGGPPESSPGSRPAPGLPAPALPTHHTPHPATWSAHTR
ncbi:polyphosphate polymerase domain-containing protein [Planctomonas deserti]|uniref:polyphosphate polymerase domain-containing protein n=1 Tax=Planctomonas deserti TaxID=2144185 RepID=UPI001F0BBC3E|nr:polyphosphate polymerase domain-containing protein [Planctomonas deserti]